KLVPWWTSKRVLMSLLCFVGFFFLYAQRVNLSVAIVCMVQSESPSHITTVQENTSFDVMQVNISLADGLTPRNVSYWSDDKDGLLLNVSIKSSKGPTCPISTQHEEKQRGEFSWAKDTRGLILGSFFWGYTVMQIPGGLLAERYGARIVVTFGMLTVSIFTLLTPVLARGSPYLLIVGRVIIGIGEATMYPSAQVLWAKWAPPHERSRLVGFAFGGCQLGNALAFPIAGFLCEYGFDGGWPSIFYIMGVASFIWCVLWWGVVRDTPRQMKGITDCEKEYIELSLGVHKADTQDKLRKEPKPWKSILTSLPVWAILVANSCGNYGAYMLLTQMPTYMEEVLKFDIKSNGVFSMIPYIGFWCVVIIAGTIADFLVTRKITSIERSRKICCCIGHFIPACFLVAVGYMTCHQQTMAVIFLTLSMSFCGFQMASVFINHGDIAPRYAGTIFGITNTGASIPGSIAPYVVAAITPNKSQEEWLNAFYIAAIVYCVGAVFYVGFGKGEIQKWAEEPQPELNQSELIESERNGDVENADDVFIENEAAKHQISS
ncbi:hypothetical protein FSP39_009222, partial [Pinctada imbricata]